MAVSHTFIRGRTAPNLLAVKSDFRNAETLEKSDLCRLSVRLRGKGLLRICFINIYWQQLLTDHIVQEAEAFIVNECGKQLDQPKYLVFLNS